MSKPKNATSSIFDTDNLSGQSFPRVFLLSWLLNILLPGTAFLARGGRWLAKTIGILFTLLWLSLIGGLVYGYITIGIREAGLTVLSSTSNLLYAEYAIYGLTAIWVLGFLSGSIFLVYKSKNRHKVYRGIVMFLSILISFSMVAGSVWAGYTVRDVRQTLQTISASDSKNTVDQFSDAKPKVITPDKPVWGDNTRINIMLLGSDEGTDRTGIRPDILMVASINTVTGSTQLFNLPRNLKGVYFPEGTPAAKEFPYGFNQEEGLINAVWTWAEANPGLFPNSDNPGLEATRDVMSETLGLDIDYYSVVNMQGFTDLVNTLGGVTVNVPRDLPKGKTGDINPEVIEAGQNRTLNGDDALWFVRSRADSDDYDRILRQRCMIGALTSEISGQTIASQLPSLLQNLRNNFFTNIDQADIKDWVGLFEKVRSNEIEGVAFTNEVINPSRPDFDAIKEIVAEATVDPVIDPSKGSGSSGTLNPEDTATPGPTSTQEPTVTPSPTSSVDEEGIEQSNPYC